MTQRLEGGGGSGRAKGGRWKVPGRANRPCTERRNGIQWPEAGGPVRASLGLKMMERRNNVIQLLKYSISDLRDGSEGKESAFIAGDTGGKSSIPGSGDPLEKEMAAHSSILAWEIPWTEEPGRLQSMGSRRVRRTPKHADLKIKASRERPSCVESRCVCTSRGSESLDYRCTPERAPADPPE